MEIYTQRKRPPKKQFVESKFEPCRTEQAGYVPPRIQIENFMIRGQQLANYRNQFDFKSEDDLDMYYQDPTRMRGFDMADATQLELQLEERKRLAEIDEKHRKEEEENDKSNIVVPTGDSSLESPQTRDDTPEQEKKKK